MWRGLTPLPILPALSDVSEPQATRINESRRRERAQTGEISPVFSASGYKKSRISAGLFLLNFNENYLPNSLV